MARARAAEGALCSGGEVQAAAAWNDAASSKPLARAWLSRIMRGPRFGVLHAAAPRIAETMPAVPISLVMAAFRARALQYIAI